MYTKNIIEWKVFDPLYTVSYYINMIFKLHIVQMSSKKNIILFTTTWMPQENSYIVGINGL